MINFKNFLKITATNKMMWVTLVVGILIVISTSMAVFAISHIKAKVANANLEEQADIIEQENLADTSKMTEEELKKQNEKELKENEKKTNTTTKAVKNKYYIKVNYGAQVVTIYTYDKNENYTIPVRACVCSTGAATPPSGVYRLSWKATWGKLFGNVWGHYCYQIVGDILFHSVPYMQNRNDTLVSTYYDRLGRKDSMGCIRLTTIDAKWIYDNCVAGTQVEFYSSSNPGPLGKPTAKKVSNAPGNLKNWDPTDPDPKNPWKDYKEGEKKPTQNTNKNETTNSEVSNSETVNNEVNVNENTNTEIENTENVTNETENTEGNTEIENTDSGNTEIENTEQNTENNTQVDTQEPANTENKEDTEESNSQEIINNEN